MDSLISQKVKEWLEWDRNEITRRKLEQLLKAEKYSDIKNIMLKRIKFGTAGLRGKMDLGYTCLNDLVIIQTAQGWCKYLQEQKSNLLEANGIVIGYDGRHNSKSFIAWSLHTVKVRASLLEYAALIIEPDINCRWAEITATIFTHCGFPVKLFSDYVPTPFISFAITKFNCAGGVMVTASHNPKEDNGYKVYDSNACQIITPVDQHIYELILENLKPWQFSWNTDILETSSLVTDPLRYLCEEYVQLVKKSIPLELINYNEDSGLVFTYSAMHGVGYKYAKIILESINVKMLPVVEQRDPDPEFPTVRFPNPEEGASSLNLSFSTAEKIGSCLIIANDPDADRFAFAEKNKTTDKWKVFSGNELGALFGWWMLLCHKLKKSDKSIEDYYMMSSTVSSMILKTMAKKHGFKFLDTLTGFKWMGNKTLELKKLGKEVLLGYEVEIGFMCLPEILDKDGVSAAAFFTTMCSYVYRKGQQICDKLEEIYSIYGYHLCRNSYFACSNNETIKIIFHNIRNFQNTNHYPTHIFNGKYKIISVRDLTTGYDSNQPDKVAVLPLSPEMITFTFDNGLICTIRTSGTESKIKYYTELCASQSLKNFEEVKTILNTMVDEILNTFLELTKYGLIP